MTLWSTWEKKEKKAKLHIWTPSGEISSSLQILLLLRSQTHALQTPSKNAGWSFRDFCVDVDPVLNPRDESPEGFTASQGHRLLHRDNMQL